MDGAILACGPGRVLSHRPGGAHLAARRRPRSVRCDESEGTPLPPGHPRASGAPASDEVTVHEGIPITTVPRTLFDLAAVLPQRQLERARSTRPRCFTYGTSSTLDASLSLSAARATRRYERRSINAEAGSTAYQSELEEMFLALTDAPPFRAPRSTPWWRDSRSMPRLAGCTARRRAGRAGYPRHRRGVRERPFAGSRSPGRWLAPGAALTYRQMRDAPRAVIDDVAGCGPSRYIGGVKPSSVAVSACWTGRRPTGTAPSSSGFARRGVDRETAAALWAQMLLFLDMVAVSKGSCRRPRPWTSPGTGVLLHTRDYEAYCAGTLRADHPPPAHGPPDPQAYRRAYEARSASNTPVDRQ